ncbi:hypothetical protein CC1G_15353 [Coprinopsis cinerea okayama7|uniref:Uncharacterized protein n=1 Tax=Coprinopsis cinerea (strain Okayama-7 / 130 / ATCC MYA-4618 / FGSC 9003) TaxID=240176 RepID=D6RQ32_COPC7|nr:hypothetical protein CC1G_15353 [Coprinopsis cinerea okayama7\|eukprot:XP_002910446.1 hypothetical protein CC1G_15353 [Coprinopsis cinerea okayama7\
MDPQIPPPPPRISNLAAFSEYFAEIVTDGEHELSQRVCEGSSALNVPTSVSHDVVKSVATVTQWPPGPSIGDAWFSSEIRRDQGFRIVQPANLYRDHAFARVGMSGVPQGNSHRRLTPPIPRDDSPPRYVTVVQQGYSHIDLPLVQARQKYIQESRSSTVRSTILPAVVESLSRVAASLRQSADQFKVIMNLGAPEEVPVPVNPPLDIPAIERVIQDLEQVTSGSIEPEKDAKRNLVASRYQSDTRNHPAIDDLLTLILAYKEKNEELARIHHNFQLAVKAEAEKMIADSVKRLEAQRSKALFDFDHSSSGHRRLSDTIATSLLSEVLERNPRANSI